MTPSPNALIPININNLELRTWSDRRRRCELLADAFRSTQDLQQYSARILACSGLLQPRYTSAYGWQLRPWAECGVALCPSCAGRFYRPRRKHFKAIPALMAAYPGYVAVASEFTVKNCAVSGLRHEIKHLHQSYERLRRREPFKQAAAYMRATELTVGADALAHPHLHSVQLVQAGTDVSNLTAVWQSAARLDYLPSVQWETVSSTARWGYLNKPPIKLTEETLRNTPVVTELFRQLHGSHLFEVGGAFKHVKAPRSNEDSLSSRARFEWSPTGGYEYRC